MLYRCPRCGHDPLDGHKASAKCSSCGTRFEQGRGAVIIVRPPNGPPEESTASDLLVDVERWGGPGTGTQLGEKSLSREARIVFGTAEGHDVIQWRGEVIPCGLVGTYEILPRWGHRSWFKVGQGREPVIIRYGEPIQFGRHDDRASRERARPDATVRIETALRAVMTQ